MNKKLSFVLISAMFMLVGCGEKSSSPKAEESKVEKPEVSDIPTKEFRTILCDQDSAQKDECQEAKKFDLEAHNVAILTPPSDIGVGEYVYFDGQRFGVVPKDEKDISAFNMLAYGVYQYSLEVGDDWCGPCRMSAPSSYQDAKNLLKDEFNLTGTKEQNEAILWMLNQNLEYLGEQKLPLKEAYFADIKAMAESLVNLAIKGDAPDLSSLHLVKDQNGKVLGVSTTPDSECLSYMGGCLNDFALIDKKEAASIAGGIRKILNTPNDYERAFETFSCQSDEIKDIYMFGVADNFSQTNIEHTNPQSSLSAILSNFSHTDEYDNNTTLPSTQDANAYMNSMFIFGETLSNLPTNLTNARMAIGYNVIELGIDQSHLALLDSVYNQYALSVDILNSFSHLANSKTYYQDLGSISDSNGVSILDYIQNGTNYIDVLALGFNDIDYIAVATCTPKPKPQGTPIPEVPPKLECSERLGESLVTIWGGDGDDFATPIDPVNPIPGLNNPLRYDEDVEKQQTFADRIALPNQTITKMVVTVNTKPSINGYQNDKIFIGDFTSSTALLHDPNDIGVASTLNGGTAHMTFGNEPVYDNNGTQTSTILDLVNTNHYIDVMILNQTKVDSVRVSMCSVKRKEGDLSIDKKAEKTYVENGLLKALFSIDINGTLPYGESLVINEVVPQNTVLDTLNAPSPWSCTPNPPIVGSATLTCSITALGGDMTNIPSISLSMYSKEDSFTNCARIDKKSQNTFFNQEVDNDSSCVEVTRDDDDDPDGDKPCSQTYSMDLSTPTFWTDANGNNPTINNPIPYTWDNSYTWFQMPSQDHSHFTLKSAKFCACGSRGKVEVTGMRIDNVGNIKLKNLTNSTSTTITSQNTATTHNFLSSYPAATGSATIPAHVNGNDYELEFNIRNYTSVSGGAIKGELTFTGHWGECSKDDFIDLPVFEPDDGPIIILGTYDLNSTPNDTNDTIAVIYEEATIVNDNFPKPITPTPIVVSGGDLHQVQTTPEQQFGDKLPANYDLAIGCANSYVSVAIQQAAAMVYETNHKCNGDWLKYYSKP